MVYNPLRLELKHEVILLLILIKSVGLDSYEPIPELINRWSHVIDSYEMRFKQSRSVLTLEKDFEGVWDVYALHAQRDEFVVFEHFGAGSQNFVLYDRIGWHSVGVVVTSLASHACAEVQSHVIFIRRHHHEKHLFHIWSGNSHGMQSNLPIQVEVRVKELSRGRRLHILAKELRSDDPLKNSQ